MNDADRGSGLIGTIGGLLVFLALMLFAVQSLVAVFTRTMVTDAAYEGARLVAGARVAQNDPNAVRRARQDAEVVVRSMLGRFGDTVQLDWRASSSDTVTLRVRARPVGFAFVTLRALMPRIFDRTVHVRVERMR